MNEINYKSTGGVQEEINEQIAIAGNCKVGIVELGVLFGETSAKFCQTTPNIPVYGIDPIITDSMNINLIGNIDTIKSNTRQFDNFKFIRDYSFNVVKDWNRKFDYLFIDASHLYGDVKRDFEDWFPLLESGGIVSLHDSACNRGGPHYWEGPSKLADELINDPRVEYVKTVFCLTIFKKI